MLDEYHSPAMTARYVKETSDGWYVVIDVATDGRRGDYRVHESVERGIFENTGGHDRPYHDTETRSKRVVAEDVTRERAFEVAERIMRGGSGGLGGGGFDIGF